MLKLRLNNYKEDVHENLYDKDVKKGALKGKTVCIMGYGSQGMLMLII